MGNIIEVIRNNDLLNLKKILLTDPRLINSRDDRGAPCSFIAAEMGNFEMVKFIVEYSMASMNETDFANRNILHYAAIGNNKKIIKYLIEKVGMDPLKGDRFGKIPMDIAVERESTHAIRSFHEGCGIELDKMYRNPVVTGAHPDPSIIRVEDDYYMVNSTFTFFPAIPILHSKDLINWRIIGHGISDPDYLDLTSLDDGRGIWAPDISYHNGKFYIVATLRLNDGEKTLRKQLVVSSEKPEGPYSRPNYIEEDGIDPSLFTDIDGRRYMLLNRGARLFEVDQEVTKIISEPELIYYGDNKRAPEGPHLLKKDDYYYLFLAEGGTGPGHCITVARSKNLRGPYEPCPYNPILTQKNPEEYIQRTGHGKPFQIQNGDWYIVYLCGRPLDMDGNKYCILGRETALDPVTWTSDGWPLINKNKGASIINYKPNLKEENFFEEKFDRFLGEKLGKEWLFARNPDLENYEVLNGKLRIYGGKIDLNSKKNRNTIIKRQKNFSFEAETKIEIHGSNEGEEAGITCYYDTNTYIKFCIQRKNEINQLKVIERLGEKENISFIASIKKSDFIYLRVVTEYLSRKFFYSLDGINWESVGELNKVYYLSDEGFTGKRFTGAMIGLYSLNIESNERAYADFHYFYYS